MIKKNIIITRPKIDAIKTAELLNKNGFECFIEPAINFEIISSARSKFMQLAENADAIITTSSNAIRALKDFQYSGTAKIISLGEATSAFAFEQGFINAEYAGENVEALCKYIKSNYAGAKLVYASGVSITKELSFENCGANINSIAIYKTTSAEKLSDKFKKELLAENFYGAAFFSSRSAEIFCELLKKEGLENHTKSLIAFCFSSKISAVVKKYGFKATINPENATLIEFIKLLANFNLHK